MKSRILGLLLVGLISGPMTANATLTITDVVVGESSLAFTIDGDFNGYAPPSDSNYRTQFSIRYLGAIWVGPTSFGYSPNTWSGSPFDNKSIQASGNTGYFGAPYAYTWVDFNPSDLVDAAATNRRVTVAWGSAYLDPSATGHIDFGWGNGGADVRFSLLASILTWGIAVPEPGTLALLGLGLVGLGLSRRRKAA